MCKCTHVSVLCLFCLSGGRICCRLFVLHGHHRLPAALHSAQKGMISCCFYLLTLLTPSLTLCQGLRKISNYYLRFLIYNVPWVFYRDSFLPIFYFNISNYALCVLCTLPRFLHHVPQLETWYKVHIGRNAREEISCIPPGPYKDRCVRVSSFVVLEVCLCDYVLLVGWLVGYFVSVACSYMCDSVKRMESLDLCFFVVLIHIFFAIFSNVNKHTCIHRFLNFMEDLIY